MTIHLRHMIGEDVSGYPHQIFIPATTDAEVSAATSFGAIALAVKQSGVGDPKPRRAADIASARIYASKTFR